MTNPHHCSWYHCLGFIAPLILYQGCNKSKASCTDHYWDCIGTSSTVKHDGRKVLKNKSCQGTVNRGGKMEKCGKKEKWALYFLHLSALNSIIHKWLIVICVHPGRQLHGSWGSNLELECERVNIEQPMFEGPYVLPNPPCSPPTMTRHVTNHNIVSTE
jgi:hypothetical protein